MDSRFITLQILARLNSATFNQMQTICAEKFSKATTFRCLRDLLTDGYVTRVAHPKKALFAYKVTSSAYSSVYGPESKRVLELRDFDLFHTLLCTEVLMGLGHYKNVIGFATEAELTKEELESFCYSRRPDAAIQIANGKFLYELAVEVESSIKSLDRIDEILDSYERTFSDRLLCRGLILVATRPQVYNCYAERIAKRSKEFDEKVFLTNDITLKNLNPAVYGPYETGVKLDWNLIRTQFQGEVKYLPLESNTYLSGGAAKTHIFKGQSQMKS